MNFIAVRGNGDPNQEDGDYKKAVGLLYSIAFTIKMSKMGDHRIDGYLDYVRLTKIQKSFILKVLNSGCISALSEKLIK